MPREHLTPNACLRCRDKRTKCDGQPTCRRCKARNEECLYEDKKLRTKGHLRNEINRLQTERKTEQLQMQNLLRALLASRDSDLWEEAWDRMRAGDLPQNIAEWIVLHSSRWTPIPLKAPVDGPAAQELLNLGSIEGAAITTSSAPAQPMGPSVGPLSGRLGDGSPRPVLREIAAGKPASDPRETVPMVLFEHDFDDSSIGPSLRVWTKVTPDLTLVGPLLDRFFAGPLSSLFLVSKRHFLQDFREGNPRYCSEALVNAMLGTACTMMTVSSRLVPRFSFEDAFIGQARMLLLREPSLVSLPDIQALGVLALAEIARRNHDEAVDLARESLRACILLLLHQQNQDPYHGDDFKTVLAMTYCGVLSLNRLISLMGGHLELKDGPLFARIHTDWGDLGDDTPAARVERGISLHTQFYSQLQFCPPLARFVFEVTEVVHTFTTYCSSTTMTAADLEGAFRRCISCHDQAAESFALEENTRADVLLAQVCYHYCLFKLLYPLVSSSESLVDGLPRSLSGGETPQTVCRQASESIICLVNEYQTRYSLSYLPPLLPHMVFEATAHQRFLAADLGCQNLRDEWRGGSPEPASLDMVYSASAPEPGPLQPTVSVTTWAPEPWSPSRCVPSPGSAVRKDSAVSVSSARHPFSGGPGFRTQSSIRNATTSANSDSCWGDAVGLGALRVGRERAMSDEDTAAPESKPQPPPQPGELAEIGYLQLMSMGEHHAGADSAASLLRTPYNNVCPGMGVGMGVYAPPLKPKSMLPEIYGDDVGAASQLDSAPVDDPPRQRAVTMPRLDIWCERFPGMDAHVPILAGNLSGKTEGQGEGFLFRPSGADGWEEFMSDSPEAVLD
ncbi:hypothetical protein N658DRAFT_506544 [Parathielavia hyrcaniae]|uniref:Zn(2)-C6 fungal-type domain-containing protein n=1 Tax=Parathielavia hyrcaniae TaxID=113614 RepID=A0AAN6Q684_9PEZI|nr:hypothetical protein N658DRAFT_506544 [Parathielavia hyrcaniae]